MVYQLAKTTPLLTGQIKMNLILNGDNVADIQYVPISKHIKFNYSNPVDTLNYTHMENIKMLYEQIADDFYKPITNPKLSTQHLYKFKDTIDDTHEGTYEMGMKRCEYRRYKKQFEFFTPVWCDSKVELENLKFEICFVNPESNKFIFKKFIKLPQKFREYLNSCWVSENATNNDLIYIDFKKFESYTQGINVEKGILETKDTSYILKTLTEQERPVLETDNMICNLFSANKLIVPQIFNFNIVFGLEDTLPATMLNEFIAEHCNVYINVYVHDELVKVKDFYSNYESIPRYNIETGKYDASSNVLDYGKDYKCINLIDKNKLVQSTIHWALRDNPDSIFNLYNGFAPTYKEYVGSKITCNEPDIFANMYDPIKNPFGIFKYTNLTNLGAEPNEFIKYYNNDDNFFTYEYTQQKEITKFGNLFINAQNINSYLLYKIYYAIFEGAIIADENEKKENDIIKLAIAKVDPNMPLTSVRDYLMSNYTKIPIINTGPLYTDYYVNGNTYTDGGRNKVARTFLIKKDKQSEYELLWVEEFIYKKSYIIGRKISIYISNFNDKCCIDLLTFEKLSTYNQLKKNATIEDIKEQHPFVSAINYLQCYLCAVEKQQKVILPNSIVQKITVSPSIYTDEIEFDKTEKSIELYRYCSNLLPLFIDTNIDNNEGYKKQPWKNNIYWVKQYDSISEYSPEKAGFGIRIKNENAINLVAKDLVNAGYIQVGGTSSTGSTGSTGGTSNYITTFIAKIQNDQRLHFIKDPDGISDYISEQTTKFLPLYPSIGYFPLNTYENVDYRVFYPFAYYAYEQNTDINRKYKYTKEFSWYKDNKLLYLPEEFIDYAIIPANANISTETYWPEIKGILIKHLNKKYLKNRDDTKLRTIFEKYICTYKTDYVSVNNIKQQKVEIKFVLK